VLTSLSTPTYLAYAEGVGDALRCSMAVQLVEQWLHLGVEAIEADLRACREPGYTVTTRVRTSSFSERLMAAKIAEMLLIVGLPEADSIRCRLLAGL